MRDLEKELINKRIDMDNIEVPADLERRLRAALNYDDSVTNKPKMKRNWFLRHKVMAAALAFLLLLGAYNYDVFAYYGKKIIGYDEVVYGSIKELNDKGMGQEIGKSYTFQNGTEVVLDGVMMDENKLIAMYRVKGDSAEKVQSLNLKELKGNLKEYHSSEGYGKYTEDMKEIAWVQQFQAPSILDRYLVFGIMSTAKDASNGEMGTISFKLDMNKAAKRMLKLDFNEVIEFGATKYRINKLSASAMSITLEGNIENTSEKENALFTSDPREGRREVSFELWQTYDNNSSTVTEKIQGGIRSIGSDGKNISFQCDFDGLKSGFKNLELNLLKTSDMRIIDKSIPITSETKNVNVTEKADELVVKQVKIQDGNTILIFDAEKDVAFGTAFFIGDKQAKIISESQKIVAINGIERLEKTYSFEGSSSDMRLMFKEIRHETYINKQITLYEEK